MKAKQEQWMKEDEVKRKAAVRNRDLFDRIRASQIQKHKDEDARGVQP